MRNAVQHESRTLPLAPDSTLINSILHVTSPEFGKSALYCVLVLNSELSCACGLSQSQPKRQGGLSEGQPQQPSKYKTSLWTNLIYLPTLFPLASGRRHERLRQRHQAHKGCARPLSAGAETPNFASFAFLPTCNTTLVISLEEVLLTTYDGAKSEELLPYHFCALRPCVPYCLYGINAKKERESVDPAFSNQKAVGLNWQDTLRNVSFLPC